MTVQCEKKDMWTKNRNRNKFSVVLRKHTDNFLTYFCWEVIIYIHYLVLQFFNANF